MIQCLQGVLDLVQMHRIIAHLIRVWLLTEEGYTHTHTQLGALREVKSSALTGLTEALLASLSATTQSFHTSLGSTLELKLVNFHKV